MQEVIILLDFEEELEEPTQPVAKELPTKYLNKQMLKLKRKRTHLLVLKSFLLGIFWNRTSP
jgi:hypothetical protein